MAWLPSRNGQSAIEVLIASALLAIVVLATFTLFGISFSEGIFAQNRRTAENLLSEGIEATRQIRNREFSLLAEGTHGLSKVGGAWTFSGTEDVSGGAYHRSVTITAVDYETVDVTARVDWTPRIGRNDSVTVATRLTDWQTPEVPSASGCVETTITGDWTHPQTIGTGDLGPGNQGTDVVVKYPYAFVSGIASASNKPDLFVFDVSNPASPQIVKSIDIGADGINALSLSGDTLYAASGNDGKELIVFDVTAPASTAVTALVDLSGSADGLSVVAKGTLVGIGRELSSAAEIVFYDMTVPSVPSGVASFSVPDRVNDFAADQRYVYAVSKSETQDVTVFDAIDPRNPVQAATYDLPDGFEDISVAYEAPGVLFIGNTGNQFVTVDASDPLSLSMLSAVTTGGEVRDIACLTGNQLFIGTNNSTQEFIILNILNLDAIAQYSSLNFPQVATGVDIANGNVYVSVRSNDALRIIGPGP